AGTKGETVNPAVRTPETYLGAARAEGWANGPIHPGAQSFDAGPYSLAPNQFAYSGEWEVTEEGASSGAGAGIEADFGAEKVFLVLGSPDGPRGIEVLLDGEPVPDRFAGEDVKGGRATISGQRLYRLVDLTEAGDHKLELRFDPGIYGYAFTFG
ncbi:MAG: cytochrome c biogenesis protein DipZ, partial [Actinomycetota bacterium]|nr:cytochrome c biogenesis protein DipZ [Actinomycetota bacterium]